jgi:adenine deaminase
LAIGQKKADLVIKNANIVNVFSGQIYNGNVVIADGIYVGIVQTGEEKEEYTESNTQNVIDVQGKFMCLGLIDGGIFILNLLFYLLENFVILLHRMELLL